MISDSVKPTLEGRESAQKVKARLKCENSLLASLMMREPPQPFVVTRPFDTVRSPHQIHPQIHH